MPISLINLRILSAKSPSVCNCSSPRQFVPHFIYRIPFWQSAILSTKLQQVIDDYYKAALRLLPSQRKDAVSPHKAEIRGPWILPSRSIIQADIRFVPNILALHKASRMKYPASWVDLTSNILSTNHVKGIVIRVWPMTMTTSFQVREDSVA